MNERFKLSAQLIQNETNIYSNDPYLLFETEVNS